MRCAIYTRQSRSSNSDFSSCQAQFEVCREFIQSQESMGWTFDGLHYEDEGESGESLDRPGLRRLLDDAESGRFDRIVVHCLDRLSRRVVDCASLLAQSWEKSNLLRVLPGGKVRKWHYCPKSSRMSRLGSECY
ncbi:recombinase family protein [Bremerella alba]|uniref:recombinase family protein n=1 Tax=Bremerella alba TaxID=980252 RepID=UPI001A954DB6